MSATSPHPLPEDASGDHLQMVPLGTNSVNIQLQPQAGVCDFTPSYARTLTDLASTVNGTGDVIDKGAG